MLKKTLFALYILTVVCMGLTTIIEKYQGTQYTADHIYGTWWFAAMWGALAAAAIFHFIKQRVRNVCVTALHLSFIIILAGALLTHTTSIKGVVHLRQGEPTKTYMVLTGDEVKEYPLPFQMSMDAFETRYYEGT